MMGRWSLLVVLLGVVLPAVGAGAARAQGAAAPGDPGSPPPAGEQTGGSEYVQPAPSAPSRSVLAGRSLRRGSHGKLVVVLQTVLRDLGVHLAPTGVFDAPTQAGLAVFQHRHRLARAGWLDAPTGEALELGDGLAPDAGWRFPFDRASRAVAPARWTLDQGVDVGTVGDRCGPAVTEVAVAAGTVVRLGAPGFGRQAPIIRLTDGPLAGRYVYYGHASPALVGVGQSVVAGQPVAEVGCGRVGRSSGPHLEIGLSERDGGPCCPRWHSTAGLVRHQLADALAREVLYGRYRVRRGG
jgi:murein DD-endopeptidase MepM/ murein hydrolase activator NlpD